MRETACRQSIKKSQIIRTNLSIEAKEAIHEQLSAGRFTRYPQQSDRLSLVDFRLYRRPPLLLRQAGHRHDLVFHLWPVSSEEHTSELQSLMRISYAVFCLKKKKPKSQTPEEQQ